MFDIIRNFLSDLDASDEPAKFIHTQKELAEAALMYHVIAVDGIIRPEEKQRMVEVLARKFALSELETADLALSARDAEHEAIDLYKFTSQLMNNLTEEERINIIEDLWEMVFADGIVHDLEDNVVWRIAELLGVSTRDRMAMKQRVWKRTAKSGDEANG